MTRRRRLKNHSIDYSATINWFGKRYYLSVVGGPESRSLPLGKLNFCTRRLIPMVGHVLGIYILVAAMVVPLILLLYFVKSVLAVDFFDGPSLLHGLFFS